MLQKLGDNKEKRLINSNNELYGACRHKSKFHRYTTTNSNTDEGLDPEKGINFSVKSPSFTSQESNNTLDTRMCIFIDTNISKDISKDLYVPYENHNTISPLSCDESMVGNLNEKIVMDV